MIRLFTTYYREKRTERRDELDLSLSLNVSAFDTVHVISDGVLDAPCSGVSDWRMLQWRAQYADLLNMAGAVCGEGDVAVIANCDIILPRESLLLIDKHLFNDSVYCLTRWEIGYGLWDVPFSQDCWCFRGGPHIAGGNYYFGVPGCDNRFAAEAADSGYRVLNPSRSIRSYHIHSTGLRTATNRRPHRVGLPYLLVAPHVLGGLPEYERPAELPDAGPAVHPAGATILRGFRAGRA